MVVLVLFYIPILDNIESYLPSKESRPYKGTFPNSQNLKNDTKVTDSRSISTNEMCQLL